MKRRHLFLFEDLPWLPPCLRHGITNYLDHSHQRTRLPAVWASRVDEALARAPSAAIVNLGPAEPLDPRSVPWMLKGLRTMFASFHRFPPADARTILADAAWCEVPICIFERTARHPAAIASSLFIPLQVLWRTPAIRPGNPWTLVFTYIIPLLPLLIFWDSLVSHLRTYTAEEMLAMGRQFSPPGYQWTAGEVALPGLPAAVPYLIGSPAAPASTWIVRREIHRTDKLMEPRIGPQRVDEGIHVQHVREDSAVLD